jgi:hypothetical protein
MMYDMTDSARVLHRMHPHCRVHLSRDRGAGNHMDKVDASASGESVRAETCAEPNFRFSAHFVDHFE